MSLASGDLTTLADAKAYIDSPPADTVLSGLITRISRMVQGTLNRPLLVPKTYTEQFSGTGTQQLVLPNWPVTAISSLAVSGVLIPIAPQLNPTGNAITVPFGYRFNPWDGLPPGWAAVVELVGTSFYRGVFYGDDKQNVVVTYTAGYQVVGEVQQIPTQAPQQLTPQQPYGIFATDQGVTYTATGQALVAVASAPVQGQYIAPTATNPAYQFANADAGQNVSISYGFIPADIEQVVLELIAERASYRRRVGVRSQSLGGQETISYENMGLSSWAVDALWPYMNVLPPPVGAEV